MGANFLLKDEIYQVKNFSRENTRVLMRLDAAKLDLANPNVHRKDHDFAVTWAKMYGKGRVFYSTLGHVDANWDLPDDADDVYRGHQMGTPVDRRRRDSPSSEIGHPHRIGVRLRIDVQ